MCDNRVLPLKPFSELLGTKFFIPYQQRGYKWTATNVEELLEDLKEFILNQDTGKRVYCLQPLAVVKMKGDVFKVLDGQQRLTTLFLLYVYLYGDKPYTLKYERDSDDSKMSRSEYLLKISSVDDELANENIDFYYIHNAYRHIVKVFDRWKDENDGHNIKSLFKQFLEASRKEKSLQVIWYEVDEKDQYTTFRNLNSGKISLTNTELIKALLLNRVSGLPEQDRLEAAASFDYIEREMQNDHFWYMISDAELRSGQTRMDLLFNIVADCSQSDYDIDSRCSFRNFFSKNNGISLSEKWNMVRHTFLRLKDLYDDIYSYHYIGFLTYAQSPKVDVKSLLKHSKEMTHSQFINYLKGEIKRILNLHHHLVTDYTYDQSPTKDLRFLFVMHNIETILQKYTLLHKNEQISLKKDFEQFPFELLHKQNWDIEHIASNTDSDFQNVDDRNDWLDSIKQDLGNDFPTDDRVVNLEQTYRKSKKKEIFDQLYNAVMRRCDEITKGSIMDDAPDGKNKMQVGNITLLDSHTNRSYHNALFPRKRRYILITDGLYDKTDDFDKGIRKCYIPPCTRQVFTKAYTKSGDLSLNCWTQTDADAYVKDMEQKLEYYFDNSKESGQ